MLNEKLVLVEQRDADTVGQIRSVKQVLDDGRLIVTDASGNPVLIRRSGALAYAGINQGDRIIVDPSVRLAIEALPAEGDKDLVLEETPDVTFADIGGLDSEIGRIRDAVQLPFQHRALFERYDLKPPKGVLLYGPPGNGKTMIAKAVANACARGVTIRTATARSARPKPALKACSCPSRARNCSTNTSANPNG